MNKEFIPYEQALELKELAFDEPCIACYDKLNMLATYSENLFDPKNYNTSGYCVSAPLYQQAFRFFREKHNLIMHIQRHSNKKYLACMGIQVEILCDTYEEAELECLKKLIEIVKGKEVAICCHTNS
jgi:hypothetical protein